MRSLLLSQVAILVPVIARRTSQVLAPLDSLLDSRGLSSHAKPPSAGRQNLAAIRNNNSFSRLINISGGHFSENNRRTYKVVQVHVVHRHGDRTPITPLSDEAFWESHLPEKHVLSKISENTKLIRDEHSNTKGSNHAAGGRGAFGKLTQMGLFQMVELGNRLREELLADASDDHHIDEQGNQHVHKGRLFHPENQLHPSKVKVLSTDFPRTIQSVQGVLVGLFEDQNEPIEIDVRHTNIMIPDPQPRQTKEQEKLELVLAERPHLKERERLMRDLAVRATKALSNILGEGAYDVSFGIGEERDDLSSTLSEPLPWAQLSEITKCLQVRGLLPPSISVEDQETISSHAAWRWFENLRHPRLAFLAMNSMVSRMTSSMNRRAKQLEGEDEHPLHIYSAHDSTLIGLMCAYGLEQPAEWPEYGSFLKVELIEASSVRTRDVEAEYFVRFSLNGEVLRVSDAENESRDMIPLDRLTKKTREGSNETH